MIVLLRVIRALFVIIFYWQVLTSVIGLSTHLNVMQANLQDPKIVTLLLIKVGVLVGSALIAYVMGKGINHQYRQKFATTDLKIRSIWQF